MYNESTVNNCIEFCILQMAVFQLSDNYFAVTLHHFISSLNNSDHFIAVQGPVVQSIVSLTNLLRVISLTVLADSIYNILKFFAEKMWVAFALQKLLTFFQQKISAYMRITWLKF